MPLGAFKAALMGTAGVSTASVVLLHDTDYSNVTTASITSGINSTYGEYIFRFYNMNPATDVQDFIWQGSTDGGSNYNATHTSTFFRARQQENATQAVLGYVENSDTAQATSFLFLTEQTQAGNGADEHFAGELHLFNPASTTYVKHFYSKIVQLTYDDRANNSFLGGYFNTTSAINAVQFKCSSGNFDGTIKMWGVK